MSKQTLIPSLLELFRQFGYDGATISRIAQATSMGKASLYHHFPGGKDEMVETVLITLEQGLQQIVDESLRCEGDALTRLQTMCDRIRHTYDNGQKPCLLAALTLGSAKDMFQARVQSVLQLWIEAIEEVLLETGMAQELARQRAEDAIIAIQGALILAQALDDPSPFQRVMQQLPMRLLQE